MDWGDGTYELTAQQLMPASERAVALCAPRVGEKVMDLGCGTGNATILLAESGATIVGVDPTPRLLGVATERVRDAGFAAEFILAGAEKLPFADSSFDALVSVFALIFTPDPPAAAREIDRVLTRDSRAVITSWLPAGAFFSIGAIRRRFMIEVGALAADAPTPFPWSDTATVANLFGPLGFELTANVGSIEFSSTSVAEYAQQYEVNPLMTDARRFLEPAGRWEEMTAEIVRTLGEFNEDAGAFKATSPYVLYTLNKTGERGSHA